MALPISFRWDEEFVKRLDQARQTPHGAIPRTAFVRDAVEAAIHRAEGANAPTGFNLTEFDAFLKDAYHGPIAPARTSQQAKRDVKPIPKR